MDDSGSFQRHRNGHMATVVANPAMRLRHLQPQLAGIIELSSNLWPNRQNEEFRGCNRARRLIPLSRRFGCSGWGDTSNSRRERSKTR